MDAAVLTSRALVATAVPRRYLVQLCKHFQHRLPAQFSETEGRVEFPMGVCTLDAASVPETLAMQVSAPDADSLERLEGVVARHLERFAFREALTVRWQREPAAGPPPG